MKQVECPICSSPAVLALSKRCCTRCGWNVLRAREYLHKVRFFPFFWLALTAFIFVLGMLDRGNRSLADLLVPTAFFAGVSVWVWLKLRKAQAIIEGHDGKVDAGALQAALLRERQKWEWLLRLPAPRQIQITTAGRRHLIRNICVIVVIDSLLALSVIGNLWVLRRQHGHLAGRLVLPVLVLCLVLGILTTLFYGYLLLSFHRRAHRLLVQGTLGLARIVKQESSDSRSVLLAEYVDPTGKTIGAKFSDPSNVWFEDMVVPLFYNPAKTKDTFVILGNDDYEIVGPASLGSSALRQQTQR
jgi:hypothetical protein